MRRFVVLSVLLVSAAAWAQSEGDSDEKAAPVAANPDDEKGNLNVNEKGAAEGTYKGVAPGAQALPPHPPRLPLKKGPQRMTWPGFQVKDGVPTVFLEVTAAPEYHVEDAPGSVIVTLKNTVVPLRNNRRALDVTAFATAVKEVSTQPKGKDVRVTIKTRGGDRPSHHERVEDAAGGFRILVIELPAK
jgi:AMIN domain-containing protein